MFSVCVHVCGGGDMGEVKVFPVELCEFIVPTCCAKNLKVPTS